MTQDKLTQQGWTSEVEKLKRELERYKKAIEFALPCMAQADQFIVQQIIKNDNNSQQVTAGFFDDQGIIK